MAAVAIIGTLWMTSTLTGGDIAVMTEDTLFRRLVMGKWCDHRRPSISSMACITQVAGQRMIARFKGARTHTIVTAGARTGLTGYGGVIKSTNKPGVSGMATVAWRIGRNVIRTLTGGNVAVVAETALLSSLVVRKRCDHR